MLRGLHELPQRGPQQLRRRPRFHGEVRRAAAPHRDPGVRRHAGRLRLPVRARLLGAAPPPEGAGGSPRPRHDTRAPRADGRGGRGCRQGRGLRGRRHRGVHRRAGRPERSAGPPQASEHPLGGQRGAAERGGRQFLFHGDEHAAAGRAPGHGSHHRAGPGGVAAARGRRTAAAAEATRAAHARPCHRGPHLRREPGRRLPARDWHARRGALARPRRVPAW
mmetsp:Transcript_5902/g.14529  ORF Transcript_5902/g.14529 Transcript_5902/m.14529 type:complete len:221 (+) Transcript_5902:2703-3365(+)